MNRIMALDIGDKKIGVAVSDPFFLMAQGLTTIIRDFQDKETLAQLKKIVQNYEINKIIIGLPKNMNNTLGPQAEKVMKFAEKIANVTAIEPIFEDERLTTVSAEKLLISHNVRRKKRKKIIDKVAAVYILQNYLDKENYKRGKDELL